MQQAHLTAWQTHSPWPKRSQIEQDLRLSRGVAAIFTDEVLRPDLPKFDVDAAASTVRREFLDYLVAP
jgi:hypothetical protein